MKKLMLTLILLAFGSPLVFAQDGNRAMSELERVLKEQEPEWQCSREMSSGVRGSDSPRATPYTFRCRREQQTIGGSIVGSVFFGESNQDALMMLKRSQDMLQVNASKPLEGIGEQAYTYASHGGAWITFRNGKVFAQVNVSLVDPRVVDNSSPGMDRMTKEAIDTARRFAQYLAQYIPSS